MVYYTGWDEPSKTKLQTAFILENPDSQPGRWYPRPPTKKGWEKEEGFVVSHSDSWFFLRILLPEPFKSMESRPELCSSLASLTSRSVGFTEPNGRIIFLVPLGEQLPNETAAWLKTAEAKPYRAPPPEGLFFRSRIVTNEPFFLVLFLGASELQALSQTASLPYSPQINSYYHLLALRESLWSKRWLDVLNARSKLPRLCGPGELLGWLSFDDREKFMRRLIYFQGIQKTRDLFYSWDKENKGPSSLIPDPYCTFSLLWDCLAPSASESWKNLRFALKNTPVPLGIRHRNLWVQWVKNPSLLEGFSGNFSKVWNTLINTPLELYFKTAIHKLDMKTENSLKVRKLPENEGESLMRNFKHKELACIFQGRDEKWKRMRHLVSARAEKLIREEMDFLNGEIDRNEANWFKILSAKKKWYHLLDCLKV